MANIEIGPMEQFQLLFNNVKNACKNDPKKLSIFYKEHAEIKEVVNKLYSYVKHQGFEKHFRFYSGKVTNASKSFISDWKEYQKDWKGIIWETKFQWLDLSEILADLDVKETSKSVKKLDEYERKTWVPDLDEDDEFDPTIHNGGEAVEAGFDALWRIVELEHNWEHSDPWIGNEAKIGYEALDYARKQIKLDFHQLYRRWFLTPKILIPPKAQKKLSTGNSDLYSCYDQLNSAIRSFVFGSDLAAFSMCRATIEQVLRIYVPSKPEEKLYHIIIAADVKFEHIHKGKIQKFVDIGNKVLHDPTQINKNTYEIEQTLLEYFKTIKFLLERVK